MTTPKVVHVSFYILIVYAGDSTWSTVTDDLGDEVYVYGLTDEEPGTMSIGCLMDLCKKKGYTYRCRPMVIPILAPCH